MTTVKLYLDWGSQPSRALAAFLIMNEIPHEFVETQLFKGQHRSKRYIAEVNHAS